jgi:hypothetical protein
LKWNKASLVLLSGFFLTILVIVYFWWPLAVDATAYIDWSGPWWLTFDWLLVGIFLAMTLLILIGADLRRDALIVLVGLAGGLVIESWGTQTNLWFYYTDERPPLWIIPAWPIASLAIDRIQRIADSLLPKLPKVWDHRFYWILFPAFYKLMLLFIWPTYTKSLSWMALALVTFLILTPPDHRFAILTFLAGSGLGYFLELWGTTRECWTYYTFQTPPVFAVFAHGLAAVAFWRAGLLIRQVASRLAAKKNRLSEFESSS